MLVIIDEDKTFLVYDELPSGTSGVNSVSIDVKNNETYNLSGRKAGKSQSGIYISKGKKYMMK